MQTLITPGDQSSRVRSSRRSATAPALGQGRDFGACGLSIRSSFLSRGIGASLVEGFRKIGYSVVANSRSIDTAGDPAVLVVDGDIAGRDTAERKTIDTRWTLRLRIYEKVISSVNVNAS